MAFVSEIIARLGGWMMAVFAGSAPRSNFRTRGLIFGYSKRFRTLSTRWREQRIPFAQTVR
jgi:hypothetical protein